MSMSVDEATAALTGPGQPFELAEAWIDGRAYRVWKNASPTLRAVLEGTAAHGDRVFVVYEGERLTFEEHLRRVADVAGWLVGEQGIRPGDRVAIAMRNLPEFSVAFWAAIAAGAVAVPVNAWWTGAELAYGLSDSGARVVFVDGERAQRLAPELPGLGLQTVVVARHETLGPGQVGFADLLQSDPGQTALPDVPLRPDDPATILYTGGTTGHPKGALGTHRNACINVLGFAFMAARAFLRHTGSVPAPDPTTQQAMLVTMPLFHVGGLFAVIANAATGAKAVLMRKWDAAQALALIEREKITAAGGVPTMLWQMLESPELARRDLSSLQGLACTGAPALADMLRRLGSQFPGRLLTNGYGLTEAWGLVTVNTGGDYAAKPESVGLPLPTNEIKLVAEDGTEAPPGQMGELWVRGPGIMKGYWNRPEATSEAITDGWFHTGDVARIDEESFVYIVDRVKDMVIRGGENIYCVEVEAVLTDHPAVAEAAVIGIPHDVLGEEVGAVVRLQPGANATGDELRAHAVEHLAAFKVPSRIWLRREPLPLSPIGKVLKQELRRELVRATTSTAP